MEPRQRAEVSHAAGRAGAALTVFFKNVTVWGPASQELVRSGCADVLAVAEHHVSDAGLEALLDVWGGAHWLAVASPARRSARAAAAGGVAV
jgi:hypothetical protein